MRPQIEERVSIDHVRGPVSHARHHRRPAPQPVREEVLSHLPAEALEFVRFCYRRRRVSWPALYDEMSAVAARGMFRGLGYAELAALGISFCLTDLPKLAAATEIVMAEERGPRDGLVRHADPHDGQAPESPMHMRVAPQPTG